MEDLEEPVLGENLSLRGEVKFCKKKIEFCLKRNFNLKVLKFYFANFCYCKFKARFLETS